MQRRSFLQADGYRRNPGRSSGPRLRAGHQAAHRALGRLHPRGRRRAEAPGAGGVQGARAPRSRSSSSTPTTCSRASPPPSSRAAAPTSSRCCGTGRTSTPTRSSTSPTSPSPSARRRAASTTSSSRRPRWAASGWRVPHGVGGNAIAYRRSWFSEIGAQGVPEDLGRVARGRQEAQGQGQAGRPGARPQLRRPADLRLPAAVGLRRGRGRPERQEGRPQQQGHARVGEVHAGVLEGRLRRGRAGLGRHQQQPRVPRRRDLAPRSTAPRSTSSPSARRTRSRTTRASRSGRTSSTRRSCRRGRPASSPSTAPSSTRVMKYSKNQKLAKDFLKWLHQKENYGKWFQVNEGYSVGAHQDVGRAPDVGQGRQAAAGLPPGGAPDADARLTRARPRPRPPRPTRSTSSSTCTPRPSRAPRPRTP